MLGCCAMKLTPLFVLVLPLIACTRRAASTPTTGPVIVAPQSVQPQVVSQRGPALENPARELMERVEGISEFAGNSQGLEQLIRALQTAFRASDTARVDALVTPILPARSQLALALTLDGGNTFAPYLTGPAGISREVLKGHAREWSSAENFSVRAATGAQIAAGENAEAYSPAMRTLGGMLREQVRFYRVDFTLANGRRLVAESWIYAGGKWMFVNEPWRFAQGSPDRLRVNPSTPAGAMLPSGGIR